MNFGIMTLAMYDDDDDDDYNNDCQNGSVSIHFNLWLCTKLPVAMHRTICHSAICYRAISLSLLLFYTATCSYRAICHCTQ